MRGQSGNTCAQIPYREENKWLDGTDLDFKYWGNNNDGTEPKNDWDCVYIGRRDTGPFWVTGPCQVADNGYKFDCACKKRTFNEK